METGNVARKATARHNGTSSGTVPHSRTGGARAAHADFNPCTHTRLCVCVCVFAPVYVFFVIVVCVCASEYCVRPTNRRRIIIIIILLSYIILL